MTRKTLAPALATALAAAAVTLAPALPVRAQGIFIDPPGLDRGAPLMGVRANVAQQLRFYGLDGVDVRRLSAGQVAQINALLHSDRSQGDIRALIEATLSRPGRLQTILSGSVGVGVAGSN